MQFAVEEGSSVRAVHDGTVAFAGPFTGYGNLVIVDHGAQTFSLYGQLGASQVDRGARVERGQPVGTRRTHPGRNSRDVLRDARRRQAGRSARMAEEKTMTSRTRFITILVSAPVIAFTVIGGLLGHAMARADETYANLRVFNDVVSLIMSNYVEQPNMEGVMRGAMRGLAEGLDSDSAYLTQAQVRQFESGEQTAAADVGITLTHQYYLRVVATRDDSPAAKAGIRPGDFVRLLDSRPTRDMSALEGQRLLAGAAGSKVKLTVIRGGSTAEPHVVELTREAPPDGRREEPAAG